MPSIEACTRSAICQPDLQNRVTMKADAISDLAQNLEFTCKHNVRDFVRGCSGPPNLASMLGRSISLPCSCNCFSAIKASSASPIVAGLPCICIRMWPSCNTRHGLLHSLLAMYLRVPRVLWSSGCLGVALAASSYAGWVLGHRMICLKTIVDKYGGCYLLVKSEKTTCCMQASVAFLAETVPASAAALLASAQRNVPITSSFLSIS